MNLTQAPKNRRLVDRQTSVASIRSVNRGYFQWSAKPLHIVDDDQNILNIVAKMVSRLGYHATATADPVDALLRLADTRYDMVISDYAMPRMDGYQLADQIRGKHFGTKIIIMTGHRDPDLIHMLMHSDLVDGLLFKPFTLDTLKETLQSAEDPYFHRQAVGP